MGCGIASSYDGAWFEGKKHGFGREVFPNGQFYLGRFVNDLTQGKVQLTSDNGETYEGQILNGMKHGQGRHRLPNGDIYEG